NQGNALEVLSNVSEKYLVNLILKYYEERLNDIPSIKRIYFMLFSKPLLNLDKNHYETQLFKLNNDMIQACLFYIKRQKIGQYQLSAANKNVRHLLTVEKK
ncbi:MAG: hypothetical protein KAH77_02015, partial [Thiomargarita sp.]|nr:hypothetical protein [Thiomargarita sp.]